MSASMEEKWKLIFLIALSICLSRAKKQVTEFQDDNSDEDEVKFVVKRYNMSRVPTTTSRSVKGEAVVEKFVDTLMASEQYLKMIDSVEKKINHLDSTFHDRTNTILKYLSEILRVVKAAPTDSLENALALLKKDLDKLKHSLLDRTEDSRVPNMRVVINEVSSDRKGRRKNDSVEKSLWRKEYEDELTDAMLSSKKKDNFTRVVQSTATSDNEIVIEKLMDSITSSEKYLKKVDSVDFRLNRLDIEVHEKTNAILKRLTEILNVVQTHPYEDKVDSAVDNIKTDIGHIKNLLELTPRAGGNGNVNNVEGADYRVDPTLDNRLSFLENHVKAILASVDSIATIISEVKSRQYSRNFPKTDANTMDAVNLITEFRRALHDQKTRKCECKIGRADRVERYPTDCYEIQIQGFNVSGIYKIKPDDMEPFYVLCDLSTAGGGWTVFQNRFDGSQDFYKSWAEYKHGFGNLAGEFWLGLEKLNYLTNQKLYELRIELESQLGQEAFAAYSVFTIGPEHEGYRISTLGAFHGSAGESLSYHAGQKFSTYDMDNDEWKDGSCATEHGGAWWYKECDKSNLNGKYSLSTEEQQGQSIYWISFKGPTTPLTKTRLMIRPLPASRPVDSFEHTRKIDTSRLRPMGDKKGVRKNEPKGVYDSTLGRAPYRYDDTARGDAFFPNYA